MKRLEFWLIVVVVIIGLIVGGILIFKDKSSGEESFTIEEKSVTIRVHAGGLAPSYAPLYIARAEDYFEEEGFDVKLVKVLPSSRSLDAVLAGKLDVTVVGLPSVLNFERNIPGKIKIIAAMYSDTSGDNEPYRIIVKSDSSIQTLSDLKGKTIVTSRSPSFTVALKLILKEFFDLNELTIRQISLREHLSALKSGGADAIFTTEPVAAVALSKGGFREIGDSLRPRYITDPLYTSMIVMSNDFIEKYPDKAEKVQRVIERAVRFFNEQETETRAIHAKYIKYPADVIQTMYFYCIQLTSEVDKNAMQKLADIYHDEGVLQGHVDVNNLFLEE